MTDVTDEIDMAELTDYAPAAEPVEAVAPADPRRAAWLRRRGRGFGASEMAIVLVALGWRSPDILTSTLRPQANKIRVRVGGARKASAVPRVLLRKAGLRARLKADDAASLGREREPLLVRQWARLVERGQAGADAAMLDAASVRYVPESEVPELLPYADVHEPRLLCTPDVFARNVFGELECWDVKCSVHAYGEKHGGAPEHVRIQVVTQMAVCGASAGGVIEGEGWSAGWRDRDEGPSGPIRSWGVERDEALVEELRAAACEGWARVESLRSQAQREAA